MKIIFAPSDLGGGLGHISRCKALAQFAKKNKHQCAFLFHRRQYSRLFAKEYKTFYAPLDHSLKKKLYYVANYFSSQKARTLFTMINDLSYQVIRDGFTSPSIVEKVIEHYKYIIQTYKPNLIIGDTNLLIGMVAKLYKIPIVQIVRSISYPDDPKTIWWEPIPKELKPPDIQMVFNPILEKLGLSTINQAVDLLKGDIYIIPSIPKIEPIVLNSYSYHVGPILAKSCKQALPYWLESLSNNWPLVYITIGGGAHMVGNYLFFNTIIDAFQNEKINVIVSTTKKFSLKYFKRAPSNIYFENWVPGREVIKRADLIIFHGGYGTMMEILKEGKPSIVIPYHTEQECNGRQLQANGCSTVCKLSNSEMELRVHKWGYGEFTTMIQTSYDLIPSTLLGMTKNILETAQFAANSRKLKKEFEKYGGPKQTFEIINDYIQ